MKLRLRSIAISTICVGLLGCNETQPSNGGVGITRAGAALTVEQNTERALRGWVDSSGHFVESQTLLRLLTSLSGSSTSCSSSAAPIPCPADATDCEVAPVEENCVIEPNEVTREDLTKVRSNAYEGIEEFIAYLRDEVFIDDYVESDDGKTVVYKLGPEVFCGSMPRASNDSEAVPALPAPAAGGSSPTAATTAAPETSPQYDPECLEDLAKWAPRIQLVSPRDGDIDLSVLLTDQRLSPLTLNLYQREIGARLDLGIFKTASERAGRPLDGISDLAGILQGRVAENGTLNYQLELSVTEMVKMVLGDKPEKLTITLAPSAKTLSLNIDGNGGNVVGQLDVSSFNLSAPLAAFMGEDDSAVPASVSGDVAPAEPPKEYHGNITGFLAGIQGDFAYDAPSDTFSLMDFGFGSQPSYVQHDGVTLLSADVNASAGRVFNLRIDASADNGPNLQFSPGLDVDVLLGFAAIADQVDFKQFMLTDRVKLKLEGDEPSVRFENEQMRVVSGKFDLQSVSHAEYQLAVEAGMCLAPTEPENAPPTLAGMFATEVCQ